MRIKLFARLSYVLSFVKIWSCCFWQLRTIRYFAYYVETWRILCFFEIINDFIEEYVICISTTFILIRKKVVRVVMVILTLVFKHRSKLFTSSSWRKFCPWLWRLWCQNNWSSHIMLKILTCHFNLRVKEFRHLLWKFHHLIYFWLNHPPLLSQSW